MKFTAKHFKIVLFIISLSVLGFFCFLNTRQEFMLTENSIRTFHNISEKTSKTSSVATVINKDFTSENVIVRTAPVIPPTEAEKILQPVTTQQIPIGNNTAALDMIMQNKALDKLLQTVQKELLMMSNQVQPKAIIIVTTWRSGSTFLGEILSSVPGTFYHYEPLLRFKFQDLNFASEASNQAMFELQQLLLCNYSPLKEYLAYARQDKEIIDRNPRLMAVCPRRLLVRNGFCYKPGFLDKACSLHPIQLIKEVRLHLQQVAPLLEDPELALHLRLIVLVRDPRAIMNSRQNNVHWCNLPLCQNPQRLCSDLQDDYETALRLWKTYPENIYLLRYEDLARHPQKTIEKVFQFLGLPTTKEVMEFLTTHTTKDINNPWTTFRRSASRVALWKRKMTFADVQYVQRACNLTMTSWGYRIYPSRSSMRLKDSILPFNFPPKNLSLSI